MCGLMAMGSSKNGFLDIACVRRVLLVASLILRSVSDLMTVTSFLFCFRRAAVKPLPFVWKRIKPTSIFENCQSFVKNFVEETKQKTPEGVFSRFEGENGLSTYSHHKSL
jgi:hypothetical protein